jgi:hypothetical protein
VLGLLDDEPLDGTVGVRRWLTAQRDACLVNSSDLGDALEVVEKACNVWGGGYYVLVPVDPGESGVKEPWRTLLEDTFPVRTAVRGLREKPLSPQRAELGGVWVDDFVGDLTLSVLARVEPPQGGYRTVRTANGLSADDPWTVAYAAAWGRLPSYIDPQRLRNERLNPGSTYSDILKVDDSRPVTLGAADLLAGLRSRELFTAAQLSCIRLGLTAAGTDQNLRGELEPPLPIRFHLARVYGPNLVVVYEPGSVTDLCLLWHLRAVHGMPPGFPLGVPVTEDVRAALAHWRSEMAMRSWNFQGGRGYLVSASVDITRLERLAHEVGGGWEAVPFEAVLQPSFGCGVGSSEVVAFDAGRATVSSVHPAELSALGNDVLTGVHFTLELIVTPVGHSLPPSKFLNDPFPFVQYRGGAVLGHAGNVNDTLSFEWPTGWTILDALLRDRGLSGDPSAPGRLAETLLRRCTEVGSFFPLLHDAAQTLLGDLAERHGMNWFKRKLRTVLDLGENSPPDAAVRLATVERRMAQLAGAPSEEELGSLSFAEIRQRIGDAQAAEAWLSWADQVGLVLRGADVRCDNCSGRSWRPLSELAPPITCRGCGRAINRPYGYNAIQFRYRATEFLLRLAKDDAIVHVLALRYLLHLYRSRPDGVGLVFGGYPGVTIRRDGESNPIGEADVLIVMSDGRFGIGECKTRAPGLVDEEVEKLGVLADALGASWTFTATLDSSAACGTAWRRNPTKGRIPHFALTAEHLFDPAPMSTLGGPHPLAWRDTYVAVGGRDPVSDDERRKSFIADVRRWDEWHQKRNLPIWRQDH